MPKMSRIFFLHFITRWRFVLAQFPFSHISFRERARVVSHETQMTQKPNCPLVHFSKQPKRKNDANVKYTDVVVVVVVVFVVVVVVVVVVDVVVVVSVVVVVNVAVVISVRINQHRVE